MINLTSRQILILALIIIIILFFSYILFQHRPLVLSRSQPPAQSVFTATLNTTNEVPAPQIPPTIQPRGQLNAKLTMTPVYTLDYQISVENLSGPPISAHFHHGPPNQAGPIVKTISLQQLDNRWYGEGQWKATDSEPLTLEYLQMLLSGNIYVNVHTNLNPNGEIRGQLVQS